MFDLVGIFDPLEIKPPSLGAVALPALRWSGADLPVRTVAGQGLTAAFAERAPASPSYHAQNGLHLFVVGEARLRADARQRADGKALAAACPLLPAGRLLSIYQADPDRFVRQLKGEYTLVLIDEQLRQASIWNSRFGLAPFYYALDGRRLLFSTSLAALAATLARWPELDAAGIAEWALFHYPLGARTYLRGVRTLLPAERATVGAGGLRTETWWDARILYDAPLLPEREALEDGAALFRRTVNDMAADVRRVRLSFTSGFDSRAIMAVLEKEPTDYLSYSFGIPGSLNVTIPQRIARDLGLPYEPITLDKDYDACYGEYALRAVMLSDCLSTLERANYPYAFERLAGFSPVVLTGLFGSELLRTFQNADYITGRNLIRLNNSCEPLAELRRLLAEPGALHYFSPALLNQARSELEADVEATLVRPLAGLREGRQTYIFLLKEGLRKYFGAELHMERPYGVNRTPFLDDEFVEFLFRAPFAGAHSGTVRPTIGNRFSSQRFYAHIIRKYRPKLLAAPTDHGYAPGDVLSPIAPLLIVPKVWLARRRRLRSHYREFKTEEWSAAFYPQHSWQGGCADWLSPAWAEDLDSGAWLERRSEFARAASLKLWLEARPQP